MARSPLFLLGAVVLAVGLGAGVAAVILRTDSSKSVVGQVASQASTPIDTLPDPQLGRRMYVQCQACHGIDGAGIAGNYPPLIASPMLMADDPTPSIRLLLTGVVRSERWNGYMPSFAEQLDDRELAAVLTYARTRWGGKSVAISAADIAAVRRGRP